MTLAAFTPPTTAATSAPPSASNKGQNPSNSPAVPLVPPHITCSYLSATFSAKAEITKSANYAGKS